MWVRNGAALAPPCTCCRIGVSTSRKPRPPSESRSDFTTALRGLEQSAGLGVDGQVDVALPDPGLGVGQALPLVRQRVQALAGHPPVRREQRQLAACGWCRCCRSTSMRSPRSNSAANSSHALGAHPVAVDQQLDVAGPVAHHREDDAAVVADPQQPARDAHASCPRRRVAGLGDRVGRRVGHGVGVDAGGRGRSSLSMRTRTCSGRRRTAARRRRDAVVRRAAVGVQSFGGTSAAGTAAWVPVCDARVGAVPRQRQEAFGDGRRDADPRQLPGCPRSRGTAAPTPAGTSRSTGTAPRAATSGRRRAALERQIRRIGPAPMRPPSSKTERNTAKFSETLVMPNCPRSVASSETINSITPLGAVGSRRIRSRETPVRPHGTKREHADRARRPSVDGLDQQAVAVERGRRAGRAPWRSRARSRCRARRPRAAMICGHLLGGDVAVPADPDGDALLRGRG